MYCCAEISRTGLAAYEYATVRKLGHAVETSSTRRCYPNSSIATDLLSYVCAVRRLIRWSLFWVTDSADGNRVVVIDSLFCV